MNHEQTAERIKVMQAYVDGKTIQVRGVSDDDWDDVYEGPMWNFASFRYRIKPEPREFEVYLFEKDGEAYITETNMEGWAGWRKIKVREVLEDN